MMKVREGCSLKDEDEKEFSCKYLGKSDLCDLCKIFVNFSEALSENVKFL